MDPGPDYLVNEHFRQYWIWHLRDSVNFITIFFWPLYFITVPIAFVGGVIEFIYYFIVGIFTGDIILLGTIFSELFTTGLIGTMINAFVGFWKILLVWTYDTIV